MPDIIGEIINERKKQDEKWGEQNHEPIHYFCILAEEIGEVAKEVTEWKAANTPLGRDIRVSLMRKELIQSAAVCVAFVEALDRGKYA